MKTIKLSKCEVDITEDKLKWGEKELVRFTLIDPVSGSITPESMLKSKIKRFEFAIKAIRENGKAIPFSKEWVMTLEDEDGTQLVDLFNEIDSKKNIALTQEKSLDVKAQVE
jgi:hypothetical protein